MPRLRAAAVPLTLLMVSSNQFSVCILQSNIPVVLMQNIVTAFSSIFDYNCVSKNIAILNSLVLFFSYRFNCNEERTFVKRKILYK